MDKLALIGRVNLVDRINKYLTIKVCDMVYLMLLIRSKYLCEANTT
jgi:hypothetical protein